MYKYIHLNFNAIFKVLEICMMNHNLKIMLFLKQLVLRGRRFVPCLLFVAFQVF